MTKEEQYKALQAASHLLAAASQMVLLKQDSTQVIGKAIGLAQMANDLKADE